MIKTNTSEYSYSTHDFLATGDSLRCVIRRRRGRESDDETIDRRAVSSGQKSGLLPEALFENDARGSHHGVAATAAYSREAESEPHPV